MYQHPLQQAAPYPLPQREDTFHSLDPNSPRNKSGKHRYRIALRATAAASSAVAKPPATADDDRPPGATKYPARAQFNVRTILHTRRNTLEEDGREMITLTARDGDENAGLLERMRWL
jgi:hypothetical protein